MRKILVPSAGHSFEEFLDGGHSSRKIIVNLSGVTIRLPYTTYLEKGSELPPQIMETKFLHYGNKRIPIEKQILEGKVGDGSNPYYQLIQKIVSHIWATEEQIIDDLIKNYAVLPDEKWSRQFIRKRLKEMETYGYLSYKKKKRIKFYKIGIPIEIGNEMFDIPKGHEIISYYICKEIEREPNGVYIDELKRIFMSERRWINRIDLFDDFIKYVVDLGCARIEQNRLKFLRYPPPNFPI